MEAAAALLRRVVGEKATAFVLEHIPSADGLNCYEIDARQGKSSCAEIPALALHMRCISI